MAWQTIIPVLCLVPVALRAMRFGHTGILSSLGNLILTLGFVYGGAQLAVRRSNLVARRLLFASIIYLPLVLVFMVFDRA